ncbi:MAG: hypothetical protein PHI29_08855 [Gallionella sp.]|nr:hypothetical protein [Gallionella sp.]
MSTEDTKSNLKQEKVRTRKGPIRRISGEQFLIMGDVLDIYALGLNPIEQTQRQAFRKLLPNVHVMRILHKNSFKTITAALAQCGLKLSVSTVRVYYSKMLPKYQAECDLRLVEAEKNSLKFQILYENQIRERIFQSALAVKEQRDSDESW